MEIWSPEGFEASFERAEKHVLLAYTQTRNEIWLKVYDELHEELQERRKVAKYFSFMKFIMERFFHHA